MSRTNNSQPDPYKIDRLAFIPVPVKAIFIKWWFAGCVYYLVGMGLGALDTVNQFDLVLVLGIVHGMVNDLLINNIFRFMRTDKSVYDPWMMFPQKKFYTFFCNILYYLAISIGVAYIYNAINVLAQKQGWVESGFVWLKSEPILYGVFFFLSDGFFLLAKSLITKAVRGSSK
ncbi:MAG: hypothetical protein MJ124_00115 [Lachnospiraceae bacterium]|nr:hypothetical protein [Lachnospiraceae bacterium]